MPEILLYADISKNKKIILMVLTSILCLTSRNGVI